MEEKIAGRTAEQWRVYAHQALDAKHKAVEEAQAMICNERAKSELHTLP